MILIAVHSRTIRMQIERLCVEGGVTKVAAIMAATAAEARAALAAHPVAGVVLDDWFPDGRGADLLAEIRNLYPALPVLSIATQLGAEAGLKADAEVPKAELVTSLVPRMRTMMRSRASETTRGRVLVVDDSRTYREQLRASLEAAGYKVILAETGEEGVRCAFEQIPDAILVDSMLPGINGAAVIRRIRSESATRRTPCLLLTASEDSREELEALEAGADTFVRKSEEIDVILARLAGVLRSASTPAAAALTSLPQRPRRVALVGVPPSPLEAVGMVLFEEGCETFSVLPAQATLEKCSMLEPDVLLFATVVDEPVLEFFRDCKNHPGLRNSRLLLLDMQPGANNAVAAIGAGADDYLPASSDRAIVLARAKSQMRRKRVEDENRGLIEHILRQELETEAQRTLAESRARHAEEMRVAYKLAEQKAHEAERARMELEQITEGIPQIVWTSDADGRNARFNRRWTDFTGLPNDDVTHGVWRRAVHPDDSTRALREWVSSFRRGLPYTSEYRLCGADGGFRWFLVRAIPLADEFGKVDRWFGTCTDIHDQKLSEEALRRTEKLAATGRLAASIAHEINNPLESVTNLLYLIEMNVRSDDATHEYTVTAQKELDRVAQISKKTLAFYRESTNAAEVDLCSLVDEVADIYSVRLTRKKIQLQVERQCESKPHGLAGELRQVISNLVTNAIDASPEDTMIRVRIRDAHRWDETGARGVRVTVADRGHGIPEALQTDLFKPFVTTKGQMGTGLGLWLSHSIVERHGGKLRLRSSTGHGTSAHGAARKSGTAFSFFVPLELSPSVGDSDSMGTMMRTIGNELLGQNAG